MARKGEPAGLEGADVEVGARVKAKRMRFRSEPETDVEFHGETSTPEGRTDLETSSGSEREHLPEEVEPGVTYRDVRVGWQASARLVDPADADEDREESEK
ncbi:MAG TPA: hypothetical protein VFY04_05850 [Solirubrobacterales bacterium]|nr:hypothetical protein [Solirubrobacterales bacterium]